MPNVNAEELNRLKEIEKKQKERYKKQNEYNKNVYDRMNFTVPKGTKASITAAASAAGQSVNAFCAAAVMRAVEEQLHQATPEPQAQEPEAEAPEAPPEPKPSGFDDVPMHIDEDLPF